MLTGTHARYDRSAQDGFTGTSFYVTTFCVLSCAVQAQLEDAEQHREELEVQLAESDAAQRQLAAARRDLKSQTAECNAAQQQLAAARQELHKAQQDHAAVRAELERIQLKHAVACSR